MQLFLTGLPIELDSIQPFLFAEVDQLSNKFLAILGSESHEGKATTATSATYALEHAKAPLPLRSDQALPHAIESLDFTSGTNLNTEQDDIGVRCSLLR